MKELYNTVVLVQQPAGAAQTLSRISIIKTPLVILGKMEHQYADTQQRLRG